MCFCVCETGYVILKYPNGLSAEHVLGAYVFASCPLMNLFAILVRLPICIQIYNRVHTLTCPIRDSLSCCKIRSR